MIMATRIWRSRRARRPARSAAVVSLTVAGLLCVASLPAYGQQPSNKEIIGSYTEPAPKPQQKQRSVDFVSTLLERSGGSLSATAADLDKGIVVRTAPTRNLARHGPKEDPRREAVAAPNVGTLIDERAGVTASGSLEPLDSWIGFAAALALFGISGAFQLNGRRRSHVRGRPPAHPRS
jgi:hypothetical protein